MKDKNYINSKNIYLAFLIFLLILTISLSSFIVSKNLKNNQKQDFTYLKTDINSSIAQIDNSSLKSSINISNIEYGNSKETVVYKYKIKINGIIGAIKYKIGSKEDYLIFNDKGEAKFNLHSNETITLYDIPLDRTYQVEQSLLNNYKTSISGDSTNIYTNSVATSNNIEFINTSTLVNDNPNTTRTNIYLFILLDIIVLTFIIFLHRIKIPRYEI